VRDVSLKSFLKRLAEALARNEENTCSEKVRDNHEEGNSIPLAKKLTWKNCRVAARIVKA
jgi:hypothetical protein